MNLFNLFTKTNKDFPFSGKNYILLFTGLLILASGYLIMTFDQSDYGFGLLGLTIGPVVVLLGFSIVFFAILYNDQSKFTENITDISDLKFQKISTITGWAIFLVSFITYALTVERTVSLWDCGEFIAASYKLEIPHPPGTPLFLLAGRLFSLFAPAKEWVALSINMVSVVASSFTVLILFHSILILAKRFYKPDITSSLKEIILLIAATVGSLSFAFSDSFWFNATEAEVYALSCLFTALVFWAMLKWLEQDNERAESKWLLFLAYLIGLSIGVHLLNLVAIPALAFVYYFKKYPFSWKGVILTTLISCILIVFFMEGIIIWIPSLAAFTDRIFVNGFSLPFGSGVIFFFAMLIIGLSCALYHSLKYDKKWLNISSLALILVLAGASSNIVIPIRSAYNPPMDENDPEDIMSLILYLKRDQYGSNPLLKGPHFTAGYPEQIIKKGAKYRKDEASGKYVIYDHDYEYVYNKKHMTLFPRLQFTSERHQQAYRQWLGLAQGQKPTMVHNLRFLFEYQLGHMFCRYFLWNFAGRESNIQDAGWLTPSDWFDNQVPDSILNNKARNNYFMIPILLGIAGAAYHFKKKEHDAVVILLLFFFSGIAINIFLNQPPSEPRERDYVYIGAFYAFSIWIAFGVFGLADLLLKFTKGKIAPVAILLLVSFSAPAIMLVQNWDDHDRTGRYFAEDLAKNMLRACPENAILFTGGDNDTFPLWYAQEVEEYRTDVRICNLSLLNMDWYIRAMKRQSNLSDPLPISLDEKNYLKGNNDQIYIMEKPGYASGIDLKAYLKLLKNESRLLKYPTENGDEVSFIPGKKLFLNIDPEMVPALPNSLKTSAKMEFELKGNIGKAELIVLDIIASNNWKRPVYFDNTALIDYPYLNNYVIKEGLLYRLMPVEGLNKNGFTDTETAYKNLIKESVWRGLNNPAVYSDPAAMPHVSNTRGELFNLAVQFYNERKPEKAKEVLQFSLSTIPDSCVPYDYTIVSYAELLFALGEKEQAKAICKVLGNRSLQFISYDRKERYHLYVLNELSSILERAGEKELSLKYKLL